MNIPLTVIWTLGLLVTVGSLCRAEPLPWLWIGLALIAVAVRLLFAEMQRIVGRSCLPEALESITDESEPPSMSTPSAAIRGTLE
jgi:hypothetical protein